MSLTQTDRGSMELNTRVDNIEFGTNILDIKVPAWLRNKFKVGIQYWDDALGGGGFTPSAVTLFTGEPGAGKTTAMLALADAITKNGGLALFNTAEESLHQVSMVVERLRLKKGFIAGQENNVPKLLEQCDKLIAKNPGKQFFLIIDSLQCMDDGYYKDGGINSRTAVRVLQMVTDWCKKTKSVGICIGQVNKTGRMAGSNKLKHMVDSMLHLRVEQRDPDLAGLRVLETVKNRFGGCGYNFYLDLKPRGFEFVARVAL